MECIEHNNIISKTSCFGETKAVIDLANIKTDFTDLSSVHIHINSHQSDHRIRAKPIIISLNRSRPNSTE
jgi:hypothetical protein